ncbi:hypothetical protein COCSADRAFT_290612 [Bipolaris sorokiniana ND90Pr]|uniref:Uncharacterized protein n=1 Tax=Cochliobolus sativus (strain ND90Pr / ATCC 201652) TaxID=665912 RepID=M2RLT9_COCSN|nr:uncharacterized protein COCSADRAFT_290612 [Bipolaris sorokiniana ND90Pr]EMD67579.1 hypothetical protein COCSADRAFT_290612 [Bipolaris sorokiniana ND90Pr]
MFAYFNLAYRFLYIFSFFLPFPILRSCVRVASIYYCSFFVVVPPIPKLAYLLLLLPTVAFVDLRMSLSFSTPFFICLPCV